MDTFIDKLAQKNIADDMIKANSEAEAKENQRIKEQISEYEQLLADMKLVNLKNIESAEKVSAILENADLTRTEETPVTAGISADDMEELKKSFENVSAQIIEASKSSSEEAAAAAKESSTEAVNNVKNWSSSAIEEVKISANDGIASIVKSGDEAVEKIKFASEEAIQAVVQSAESLKDSSNGVASGLKESSDVAIGSIKETCEAGVVDIKQATDSGVYDLKSAADATVYDIKTAAQEGVDSIKQASAEATETLKQVISEGLESIKQAAGGITTAAAPEMDKTYLDAQFDDVHDAIHTENVKVYRNVQAAVDDSLADQTKAVRGYIERSGKEITKIPVMLGVINFGLDVIILLVIVLKTLGVF